MSDQPMGPGWWQASDGRWYAPELHPDATAAPPTPAPTPPIDGPPPTTQQPAPWLIPPSGPPTASGGAPPDWTQPLAPTTQPWATPPAAPGKRAVWPIALAIVIALVVIGAVAALAARSSDDNAATASSSSLTNTRASHTASSTSASDGTDAASSIDGTPAGGQVLQTDAGDVQLTLPTDWVGVDVEHGIEGAGAQLFPNDPDQASVFEGRLTVLPRAILLFGVDVDSATAGFANNVNVLPDATAPHSLSLGALGAAEMKGITVVGADVIDSGVVDLGSFDAYRFTYETSAYGGVAFVVKGSDRVWVVIYTFKSLTADNTAIADGSAATLVVP